MLMLAAVFYAVNRTSAGFLSPYVHEQIAFGDRYEWGYQITHESHAIVIYIDVVDTSVDGLEAFAAYNREIGRMLAREQGLLAVNIVFDRPISVDAANQLMQRFSVTNGTVYLRLIDHLGDRITLAADADTESELIVDESDTFVFNTKQPESGFQGVYEINGTIPSEVYPELLNYPQLFMVDVTPAYVKRHLPPNIAADLASKQLVVLAETIYPYLEAQNALVLAPPHHVIAAPLETDRVRISWENGEGLKPVDGYIVYKTAAADGRGLKTWVGQTADLSLVDPDPTDGYVYIVEAYNLAGERSPYSDPVRPVRGAPFRGS